MKYTLTLFLACVGLISGLFLVSTTNAQAASTIKGLPLNAPLATASQPDQSLDKIVAVVNNDVILKSELDSAVTLLLKQRGKDFKDEPKDVLRSQVLNELITRKLQLQAADRAGIKVSKAELRDALTRIAQQNHMSLQQFAQAVSRSGMNMSLLQQRVSDHIKIAKVRQKEVTQTVAVSNADVSHFLRNQSNFSDPKSSHGPTNGKQQQKVMVREAHLRHIILKPNAIRGNTKTRALAREIRGKLLAGASFTALAQRYSDDKATSEQGGDVGWIPLERLSPETRKLIENLEPNQYSQIIPTRSGYEIIELLGWRDRNDTKESQRAKARQALGQKRAMEKGDIWLRQLRDEAYIDIRMPGYKPDAGKLNLRG